VAVGGVRVRRFKRSTGGRRMMRTRNLFP
jgi:hypothetical protein